jgi:hypothetical protein
MKYSIECRFDIFGRKRMRGDFLDIPIDPLEPPHAGIRFAAVQPSR